MENGNLLFIFHRNAGNGPPLTRAIQSSSICWDVPLFGFDSDDDSNASSDYVVTALSASVEQAAIILIELAYITESRLNREQVAELIEKLKGFGFRPIEWDFASQNGVIASLIRDFRRK